MKTVDKRLSGAQPPDAKKKGISREGTMELSNKMKEFSNPLMDSFSNDAKKKSRAVSEAPAQGGFSALRVILGVGLVAVLGILGYMLYQSQQQIKALNTNLLANQEELAAVGEDLETSQTRLGELQEGLEKSSGQINAQKRELTRYQQLYSGLKEEQAAQTKELEAISVRKADQAQVDQVRDTAAGLSSQVGELNSRMEQTSSNISDLREQTARNRQDIDGTQTSLATVKGSVENNSSEIATVKHSLERDFFNFELHKDGGVMKVHNVALSLKRIDFKNQKFTIEVIADGRSIKKSSQYLNEPIYFYVADSKKPYEVRINKVDKKFVVGQLSVPKS